MSNYTNQNNVEKYLNATFPTGMSTYVSAWISAVDNWIENYLGRKFKDAASVTKYYDADQKCEREIYIDNFIGDPTVVQLLDSDGDVDMTLVLNDDYITAPYNETVKNRLILREWGRSATFGYGMKRVAVTASFGASTIPADVTLAATMLVARIGEKYLHGGEIKSESVGDVSISYKEVDDAADAMGARNILDQYRMPQLA